MTRRTMPRIVSLGISLILASATVLLGAGPAAANQVAASAGVATVHGEDDAVGFDELQQLVVDFQATGEVRGSLLPYLVDLSESYYDRGYHGRAIHFLESFQQYVPRFVSSPAAQETLIGAAAEVIAAIQATSR